MARIESEAAKALKTMANNAIAQNKHISPKEWDAARARVRENEAKGLRLDGAPQSSSIYGVAAKGGVPVQVQRRTEPEPEATDERRAREHAEMERALAAYRRKKYRERERLKNEKKRAARAQAGRELVERMLRELENGREGGTYEAGSDGEAHDEGKPQSCAGAADAQAGADGVREAQARGDRECGNEDRGDPRPAPVCGRGIGGGRGITVPAAVKEKIRRLYFEERKTYAQIAQATGYSHGHVWKIVNRQDGPDKRWKVQAEKRREIIARYEDGERDGKRLAQACGETYERVKSIIERYERERNMEQGMVALYPNLEKWRIENGMSHSALARACGVCPTNMTNIIYGRGCDNSRGPTKMVIDRILEVTGLTYEEAFKRDIRRIDA